MSNRPGEGTVARGDSSDAVPTAAPRADTGALPTLRSRNPEDPRSQLGGVIAMAANLGVVAIGAVDYFTGTELRVFPLYFLPISAAAWWAGYGGGLATATTSALAWLVSNVISREITSTLIEAINFFVQLSAFALIAWLIASLRAAHARERAQALTDALTELLNLRGFFDVAPRLLALTRRQRQAVTVAYVDLDNFKQINDSLGHAEGDAVLRVAADVLRSGTRQGDVVARLGGDEFVLLLPQADLAGAQEVLERLHRRLQRHVRAASDIAGASMGAVVFDRAPEDLDEIIKRADAVMYTVKTSGRGKVVIVDAETSAHAIPPRLPAGE